MMPEEPWHINWKGPQTLKLMMNAAGDALVEFGLRLEGAAKQELYPEHGVKTGTLRRSIHIADPSYNWGEDDVIPSPDSPEKGGNAAEPKMVGDLLLLEVGSGLRYALPVHQGHHSFGGYHYITKPFDRMKADFEKIYSRKAKEHGLK